MALKLAAAVNAMKGARSLTGKSVATSAISARKELGVAGIDGDECLRHRSSQSLLVENLAVLGPDGVPRRHTRLTENRDDRQQHESRPIAENDPTRHQGRGRRPRGQFLRPRHHRRIRRTPGIGLYLSVGAPAINRGGRALGCWHS